MNWRKIIFFIIILFLILLIGVFFYIKSGPDVKKADVVKSEVVKNSSSEVEVIEWVSGLYVPWGLVFLDEKTALVSERNGNIRIIIDGKLKEEPYLSVPVIESGEGGLLGIEKHPDFPKKPYVYVMHTTESDNRISRIIHNGEKGIYEGPILNGLDKGRNHNGGRIKFGPDGYLYITTGEQFRAERAQDLNTLSGKILRITDEGKIPEDNPFNNEIYSYGHRNSQGLAWNKNGTLFSSEHGPSGEFGIFANDEINKIIKGGNYGWPLVVATTEDEKYINPIIVWQEEAIPPAGMTFLGDRLFVATLRSKSLFEIIFDNNENPVSTKRWFSEEDIVNFGRLRDVVSYNNELYILTSNRDGRGNPSESDDKILKIRFKK